MKIIDTKITTEWHVRWTPFEIARDFLQNFVDENPIPDIAVKIANDTVVITAPKEFDPELLDYLVSFKSDDKIGKYGEGFKAATLNTLRDYGGQVAVDVGGIRREWYLEEKRIGGRQTRVMMCRVSEVEKNSGTRLSIQNCPQILSAELERSLTFFYYPDNPLFGKLLANNYENDIMVYRSEELGGYLFYGKILRATLDVPLVLVCNRAYKKIDEKIEYDRDRKSFTSEVLSQLLKLMMKPIAHRASVIVEILEPWWSKGHPILSSLAASSRNIGLFSFPDNYYAKTPQSHWDKNEIVGQIRNIEDRYRKDGNTACPSYMAELGMKNARKDIAAEAARQRALHEAMHLRTPDSEEKKALAIVLSFLKEVHSELAVLYENVTYTIGDSDELLGELRQKRWERKNEVLLAEMLFTTEFSRIVSVVLHEWAHLYGFDGSRGFTDALTDAIAAIIHKRRIADLYEKRWEKARKKLVERVVSHEFETKRYIANLSELEKTKLLEVLTENELKNLIVRAQ